MRNSTLKIMTYFALVGFAVTVSENPQTRVIAIILLFILTYIEFSDFFRKIYRDRDQKLNRHIDEIQKSQSKIKRDKTRFLSLIDTMGSALVLVDIDGNIKYVNKEFNLYFGPKEYVGNSFEVIIEDKGLTDFIKSAYLKEIKMKSEMESNGNTYELIATPLFEDRVFIGCIILSHDITLIKNSEKMQKGFIADASHELRTPITAIKGMSEILLRDEEMAPETEQEFLQIIHNEGKRLELIVEDLMQMSRLERSFVTMRPEEVNVLEVVSEVFKALEIEAKKSNLTLVNEALEINIKADRNMFYRLISNLVKNAIAYSDKGDIKVVTTDFEDSIVIQVIDNGIGIPKDDLSNIFERFYRVDKARTRDNGGTGLGLSICKKIVELHEGFIHVESTVGEGTTFNIVLYKEIT